MLSKEQKTKMTGRSPLRSGRNLRIAFPPRVGAVADMSSAASKAKGETRAKAPVFAALSLYATDLTEASRGAKLESDDYSIAVRRVLRVLARKQRNNPVLGTDNLVQGRVMIDRLARRIAAGEVPSSLRDEIVLRSIWPLGDASKDEACWPRGLAVLSDAWRARSVIPFR